MNHQFITERKIFGSNIIDMITDCDDKNELKRYLSEAFALMDVESQIKLTSIIANTDTRALATSNITHIESEINAAGYEIFESDGWYHWSFNDGEEGSSDFDSELDAVIDAYGDMIIKNNQ